MKRILTLIGSIVGIVYSAIFLPLILILFLVLIAFTAGSKDSVTLAMIGTAVLAVGVVALVLDAIATKCFSCSHEKYVARRALLISAAVFNVVPTLLLPFLFMFSFYETFWGTPISILGAVSSVFIIVDLCLEKKRVEKQSGDTTPPQQDATENLLS